MVESLYLGLKERDIQDCVNMLIVSDHGKVLLKSTIFNASAACNKFIYTDVHMHLKDAIIHLTHALQ